MKNLYAVILISSAMSVLVGCSSSKTVRADHAVKPGGDKQVVMTSKNTDGAIVSADAVMIMTVDPGMTPHGQKLVDQACQWLGVQYKWAGTDREGVDCSALMQNVYREALDLPIPRNSYRQYQATTRVEREQLVPGDLVFFRPRNMADTVGHVGLYIGNDQMIHASSSRGVVVSNLSANYYTTHLYAYGRVGAFADMALTNAQPVAVEVAVVTAEPVAEKAPVKSVKKESKKEAKKESKKTPKAPEVAQAKPVKAKQPKVVEPTPAPVVVTEVVTASVVVESTPTPVEQPAAPVKSAIKVKTPAEVFK